MGKVIKVVLGVALLATAAFGNPFAFAALAAATGGLVTVGTVIALGASLVLSGLAGSKKTPPVPSTQLSRLNVSMDVSAPRKFALGTTAFPLDLRYHEGTGTNQEYIHYIVAHAAHEVASIDEIWFEQDQAWTAGGGVTSKYSGYLTVTTRTLGAAGNEIAISGNWGAGERLTGCAYTYFKIKRTGNTDTSESPLVSGIPSRVTVVGQGALLYDPRLDSTVTGGSGAHRADDQTTWGASYSPADSYDNPALQLLWFLLGWKINSKLSVGAGVPPARIDFESFIAAANICDESVALAAGGTQERYRSSGTGSDADDRLAVINTFLTAMNGTLRDTSGKLALSILENDLADYVLDLDDDDLLDEFQWMQTRGLTENYNVVRGRFVDPSNNSLYQMVDYPEISIASPDGIDRVLSLDLAYVEEGRRAQRIAKQQLQRNQYRGTFSGVFSAKALGCDVGEVIRLSLEPLGFANKLFRVVSKQIGMDGRVPLTLVEENAAIYAWDADESALVTATAPTVYDPLNSPFILADVLAQATAVAAQADASTAITDAATAQGTADGKVTTFIQATAPTAEGVGDLWLDSDDGNKLYRATAAGAGSWVAVQDAAIATAISDAATAQSTADGKIISFYQASAPTAEATGDFWTDTDDNITYRWSGSAWVNVASLGAAWGSNLTGRPTELTDGRITAGLTATGDVSRNLPSVIKSNITADQIVDGTTYKRYLDTERTKLTGVATGATVGAAWGSNLTGRPTNISTLVGTEPILNTAITINAAGTLTGAGAGSVTFGGLGGGALGLLATIALTDAKITNKSLANLDSTANTKLSGIAAGATVGANLLTNVTNKSLANLDVTARTELTNTIAAATTAQATADGKVTTYLDDNEPFPVSLQVGDPVVDSPSLSMDFTAAFSDGDIWFTPTSKLVSRWSSDNAAWTLSLADITKSVSGAASLILNYESGGTISTNLPKISPYQVSAAGGSPITTGVTWTALTRLVDPQVAGDFWAGTVPSITSGGTLSINSGLITSKATIDIKATVGGVVYPAFAVEINKVVAAPVAAPTSGSSFDSTPLSGAAFSATTFAQIAALTVTTASGSTSTVLTASAISISPDFTVLGTVNVQFKWQYESAPSTWTDVGTATDSSPDPRVFEKSGETFESDGEITCTKTQTGLTASTEYNFRLMARNSTGTRSHYSYGTASAQG